MLPKAAHGDGDIPVAYLDPQGVDDRDHSHFAEGLFGRWAPIVINLKKRPS